MTLLEIASAVDSMGISAVMGLLMYRLATHQIERLRDTLQENTKAFRELTTAFHELMTFLKK